MSDHGNKKKPFDLIRRGEKKPTPSGTLTFIGLRLADIPLQYALLYPSSASTSPGGVRLLTSLGLRTIYTHPFSFPTLLLSSPSFSWTTSPSSLILLLMSAGSAAKQIYWQTAISQESFPASAAAAVSVYNTVVNSANTLLFLALGTTSLRSWPSITNPFVSPFSEWGTLPLSTILGTLFYVTGMTIETLSERQRAVFKARPENKGRVCKVGLWSWARHINYFGYALWRGGYCMVASGWVGGIVMGVWQAWDLGSRAVVVQDDYCGKRYGEQWVVFKREVPYRIVPGVW
ncbi:hypothetical protein EV127DRAFT_515744 [Xylaria flabelliformis]|nr:hypothetical protein EV127DRAFT_515744 [Xylaria flabelliformis]